MRKIKNEAEYNAIVKRIDELLKVVTDENYGTVPETIELDLLSSAIEEYEAQHFPMHLPKLADVVKLRMYEMDLTQKSLAEMLNISPSRVSEILSGKSEPTLQIARDISRKLNISASVVLGVSTYQAVS